jgi:polar amino acid transport system substrate-binding protein
MEMLRTARAEAFALSRDALPPFVAKLPGSRIVDGAFQQTSIAIALPKERAGALRYLTAFMQEAKSSGLIRSALDKAGARDLAVAP